MSSFAEAGAAEAWRQAAAERNAYLARPTARMFALARLRPGARILVLGGGTGDETLEVAAKVGPGGQVVMTDLAESMVGEARKAVAEAGLHNVRCLVMDASALQFKEGEFDAIVARNVLMFIPDLPLALSGIRRVLRPGGRLVGTTWSSPSQNPRLRIPLDAAATVGVKIPSNSTLRLAQSLNRPDRLGATLRRAGFEGVAVEKVKALARPSDWEAFVAGFRHHVGTREVARLIPEDRRERFWRSLDRRFMAHQPSGELNGEQLVFAATRPAPRPAPSAGPRT